MTAWLAWAWVIGVDLAVVAGAVAASYDRAPFPSLRPQHVVAATILGLTGWEAGANIVSTLLALDGLATVDVAFLAAQAIFAIGAIVAFVFVIRRRRWAVVLGIGLAVVRFVLAVLDVVDLAAFSEGDPTFVSTVVWVVLVAAPLLVAAWLFVDPFLRGQLTWRSAEDPAAASLEPATDPDADA